MKKIILSAVLASVMTGSLFASDTTALTRSTVKLIKAYHNLDSKMNSVYESSSNNSNKIDKLEKQTTSLGNQVKDLGGSISDNRNAITQSNQNMKVLQGEVDEAKLKAGSAESLAKETQKMLLEVRGIKQEVVTTSGTAVTKAENLEQRVILLETTIGDTSRLAKDNESRIKSLSDKLTALDQEFQLKKDLDKKKFEELEAKIESMKLNFEAEIRVLRAKLDRTNPVYVIDRAVSGSCEDGNCGEVPDADKVIDNFLKD